MANSMIEDVLKDALKSIDERAEGITKDLDRERDEYRKRVQPLEEELAQLQEARSRLTGETATSRRAASSDGGNGRQRRPRGQVREAIFAAVKDRPGASAAEIAQVVGGSKASITSSLQKYASSGELVKEKRPEGGVGFRLA